MKRWALCVLLVACGGSGDDTDGGGVDATTDQTTDAKLDVAQADAPNDVTVDAPIDASDGAADADDGASDAGADVILVDGGLCGLCIQGTVCCTIPKAIDYGKCYNPKCLACCQ